MTINSKKPYDLVSYIKEEYVTSDTVFIIGGGPSVKTIIPEPEILNDFDVICCNNAYKLFPNAMLLHFADKVWWNWHQDKEHKVKETFHGEISTATSHKKYHLHPHETRVSCFHNGNKQGAINKDVDLLDGSNTGHQAINIAYHLGYTQIVLIGFDMNRSPETHWHNQHRRRTNVDNFTNVILPGFERITQDLQTELGIQIWNLNPKSAIKSFPFATINDFI